MFDFVIFLQCLCVCLVFVHILVLARKELCRTIRSRNSTSSKRIVNSQEVRATTGNVIQGSRESGSKLGRKELVHITGTATSAARGSALLEKGTTMVKCVTKVFSRVFSASTGCIERRRTDLNSKRKREKLCRVQSQNTHILQLPNRPATPAYQTPVIDQETDESLSKSHMQMPEPCLHLLNSGKVITLCNLIDGRLGKETTLYNVQNIDSRKEITFYSVQDNDPHEMTDQTDGYVDKVGQAPSEDINHRETDHFEKVVDGELCRQMQNCNPDPEIYSNNPDEMLSLDTSESHVYQFKNNVQETTDKPDGSKTFRIHHRKWNLVDRKRNRGDRQWYLGGTSESSTSRSEDSMRNTVKTDSDAQRTIAHKVINIGSSSLPASSHKPREDDNLFQRKYDQTCDSSSETHKSDMSAESQYTPSETSLMEECCVNPNTARCQLFYSTFVGNYVSIVNDRLPLCTYCPNRVRITPSAAERCRPVYNYDIGSIQGLDMERLKKWKCPFCHLARRGFRRVLRQMMCKGVCRCERDWHPRPMSAKKKVKRALARVTKPWRRFRGKLEVTADGNTGSVHHEDTTASLGLHKSEDATEGKRTEV